MNSTNMSPLPVRYTDQSVDPWVTDADGGHGHGPQACAREDRGAGRPGRTGMLAALCSFRIPDFCLEDSAAGMMVGPELMYLQPSFCFLAGRQPRLSKQTRELLWSQSKFTFPRIDPGITKQIQISWCVREVPKSAVQKQTPGNEKGKYKSIPVMSIFHSMRTINRPRFGNQWFQQSGLFFGPSPWQCPFKENKYSQTKVLFN